MITVRSALMLAVVLVAGGCRTVTQCDCVAPTALVHGSVSGAAAPVDIEVRMAPGDCSGGSVPPGTVHRGRSDGRGDYEVVLYLNQPGLTCLTVTALTLDVPQQSVTKRVPVTLEVFTAASPQRIRVDLALGSTGSD
jgi:hypothetical protein